MKPLFVIFSYGLLILITCRNAHAQDDATSTTVASEETTPLASTSGTSQGTAISTDAETTPAPGDATTESASADKTTLAPQETTANAGEAATTAAADEQTTVEIIVTTADSAVTSAGTDTMPVVSDQSTGSDVTTVGSATTADGSEDTTVDNVATTVDPAAPGADATTVVTEITTDAGATATIDTNTAGGETTVDASTAGGETTVDASTAGGETTVDTNTAGGETTVDTNTAGGETTVGSESAATSVDATSAEAGVTTTADSVSTAQPVDASTEALDATVVSVDGTSDSTDQAVTGVAESTTTLSPDDGTTGVAEVLSTTGAAEEITTVENVVTTAVEGATTAPPAAATQPPTGDAATTAPPAAATQPPPGDTPTTTAPAAETQPPPDDTPTTTAPAAPEPTTAAKSDPTTVAATALPPAATTGPEVPAATTPKPKPAEPCSAGGHKEITDAKRHFTSKESPPCDKNLNVGWYRFKVNGQNAELANTCLKAGSCGATWPMRLDMGQKKMPKVGEQEDVDACTVHPGPFGLECCSARVKVSIKGCEGFFIYKLEPTQHCKSTYCVQKANESVPREFRGIPPPPVNTPLKEIGTEERENSLTLEFDMQGKKFDQDVFAKEFSKTMLSVLNNPQPQDAADDTTTVKTTLRRKRSVTYGPDDIVYVKPTPRLLPDGTVEVVFYVKNSGKPVPKEDLLKLQEQIKSQVEKDMGVKVSRVSPGIPQYILDEENASGRGDSNVFMDHLGLFITMIVIACFCIISIIVGLILLKKCRNDEYYVKDSNKDTVRMEGGGKPGQKHAMESPLSDEEIMKDEKPMLESSPLSLNGHGGSMNKPEDDGWVVPYEDLPCKDYKEQDVEDTKL